MALLVLEGFDKYGGPNTNGTAVAGLLTAGEWTSNLGTLTITAGLSATGFALSGTGASSLQKTLGAPYSRLIGGVRFASSLQLAAAVQFGDGSTPQATITINTSGNISVRNGTQAGTILGTSGASVAANSIHYLEWDITFGNAAAHQLWLDGVSILSGTGDTTTTANNSASSIIVGTINVGTTTLVLDDLYLFDTAGTTNNAVLLTSPRIETQVPIGDGVVQFAVGAAILGTTVQRIVGSNNATANQLRVRPFTPTRAMTLNSIGFSPAQTNATANFRGVVYSDSAGLPGTLLSAGSTVTGIASNVAMTLPLTTPQALAAGTQYWLGHMGDTLVTNGLFLLDASLTDRLATVTFSSGAPGTAPATGTGQASVIWGNVSGAGANYYSLPNPPAGNNSYVYDATVSHEDLYNFPALSVTPSAIHAVSVKASVTKSDAGAKTMSVRLKSGATDSAGTGGTSLAPGTSFAWVTSHYATDPNTSAAWTLSALNAAQAGVKVES